MQDYTIEGAKEGERGDGEVGKSEVVDLLWSVLFGQLVQHHLGERLVSLPCEFAVFDRLWTIHRRRIRRVHRVSAFGLRRLRTRSCPVGLCLRTKHSVLFIPISSFNNRRCPALLDQYADDRSSVLVFLSIFNYFFR